MQKSSRWTRSLWVTALAGFALALTIPVSSAVTDEENLGAPPEQVADSGQSGELPERQSEADAKDLVTLNLLNINDFHGRIDGRLSADDSQLTESSTVNFAWQVETLRQQHGAENTLFLSAGDNVGASLFPSAMEGDEPTIDLLNTLGLDATATGNHELDEGWDDLNGRLVDLFDAPVLGANVYWAGTNSRALPAYVTLQAAGLRVAVIGAVTQETPTLVNPALISELSFGDPVEAVNQTVDELLGKPEFERPDIIVAEYHEGARAGTGSTIEEQMARSAVFRAIVEETSPRVDAIFTGHSHQEYAWAGPIPGAEDDFRPIVQTGSYGKNVGQVELRVDRNSGEVDSWSAQLVAVPAADALNQVPSLSEMKQDPTVAKAYDIVLAAMQKAKAEGDVQVATLTAPITTAFTDGTYPDGYFTPSVSALRDNRAEASSLGTLVSDMFVRALSHLPGAPDIGINNPGGMRADLYPGAGGKITVAEARAVTPFNNELSIVYLTGEQIVTLLEQQWQRTANGEVPSPEYLQLGLSSNVDYTFTEIPDPIIEGATLGVIHSVNINGEPLDPQQKYGLGMVAFLAAGGDNFHVLKEGEVLQTGLLDWEAWLNFLREESPLTPNFARAGVQVEGLYAGDRLAAGQNVSVTFSGMNVPSVGAPQNTEVSAWLGTEPVATNIKFEGDRVTINFTVPSAAVGEVSFRALFPNSGTVVQYPVLVEPKPIFAPSITVDPGTVTAGQPVLITGKGWPPNVAVQVSLGELLVGETASEEGLLSAGLTVPEDFAPGNHTVTASSGEYKASATLKVTAASVTPDPDGDLAKTGASVTWFALAALAAAGGGYTLLRKAAR